MEGAHGEPDKDIGKAQFQDELNKWFESRGIIADLRSHLRHLMITALQNTQIGLKPADRTSPKAQALNMIVAEYLHRHGCHYTLSVFTSEVPTLASFSCINPTTVLKGDSKTKKPPGNCFQEREVEEILDALGMPSCGEELQRLKDSYLQKNNETSLLELFLQAVFQMSTKLEIRPSLEGFSQQVGEGERLLSKKWSSRIVDILLSERVKPPQITAIQQAIFRVTENEVKRIAGEERRFQIQVLAEREKRIQEYLKKHEDDIFLRIMEADKNLTTRKDLIEEELNDRQRHLTRMAMEWSHKHDEILRLSKNFHNIEKENEDLRRKVEELETQNHHLGAEGEEQNKTIDDLQQEMSSLMNKLKEMTESNAVLSERIEVLIRKETKEVSVTQENANQEKLEEDTQEIPLLWSRNRPVDDDRNAVGHQKDENNIKLSPRKSGIRVPSSKQPDNGCASPRKWDGAGDAELSPPAFLDLSEEEDGGSVASPSSSSEEIIADVRKKIQNLEEESDRIKKHYLEYKMKCLSVDTDSEPSGNLLERPHVVPNTRHDYNLPLVIKETKCSQTGGDSPLKRLQKFEERKEKKVSIESLVLTKKTEEIRKSEAVRAPTKRQLQNRDFFLQSRQLLQELEKQKVEELHTTTPSNMESSFQISSSSSCEELRSKVKKKNLKPAPEPVLLTPLRTTSFYCNEEVPIEKKPSVESIRSENSVNFPKIDTDCLALLEETRIKSPQQVGIPLRQQILEEEKNQDIKSPKLGIPSPSSASSGKLSVGKESRGDGFW